MSAGRPDLPVHQVEHARVAGHAHGLGDPPRVAQHNVLLRPGGGDPAQDRVRVVGHEVGAPVHVARGVRVGAHGVDGLEADRVGAHETHEVLPGARAGEEVVRRAVVDLGHGLDRVAAGRRGGRLRDVRVLSGALGQPLGEGLLVHGGPDGAQAVAGAAVDGPVGHVVDGDVVVDVDLGRVGVVLAALAVELDAEAALLLLLLLPVGRVEDERLVAADPVGVRPRDGVDGRDEPAVGDGALHGVVELGHLDHLLVHFLLGHLGRSQGAHGACPVHAHAHAQVDGQVLQPLALDSEAQLVGGSPDTVGGCPLTSVLPVWSDGLHQGVGQGMVGQVLAQGLLVKNEVQLATLQEGLFDLEVKRVLESNMLKV